jgi:alkyl hydroperoxide reductase subunit AhpC
MATLVIDDPTISAAASASTASVRSWLNGSWALLFSDPEHFAPNSSTPKGYLTCLASVLAENGIKLLELHSASSAASWVDESDPQRRTIVLAAMQGENVLDLHAHTLLRKIQETARPFVMVLDQHSQCRTTLNYRPENIVRPRTLEDIVETIYVLRGDEPAPADAHEDCEQEQGWRVKTW